MTEESHLELEHQNFSFLQEATLSEENPSTMADINDLDSTALTNISNINDVSITTQKRRSTGDISDLKKKNPSRMKKHGLIFMSYDYQ